MREEPDQHNQTDLEDLRKQIPAYLSGMLNERARRAFEEGIAGEPSIGNEIEELRILWDTLPDWAPEGAPTDFWPQIREQLPVRRLAFFPNQQSGWRFALSFAAGILLGLGMWLVATGGPATGIAAEEEFLAHDSIFETLDPIPLESIGGIYLAALPLDEGGR
ncbi:hypothetical protein ACFL44_00385 [Gemmatimonadota bacterium]